ncbi:IDEAL domain-containing protein [Paenibacillus sp. TRM 82003]|nr:IDEAL domain-containing protein [Paenibacillus sp. TRM 82003]
MDKMVPANEAMRHLMAELILDKAIREYREKELYREIDMALARGDEATFLLLTSELRSLLSIA